MTRRPKLPPSLDRYGMPQIRVPDPVRAWPVYLLKRVPEELRDNLNATAEQMDWSVADVIRDTLCQHYQLDCPPRSFTHSSALKPGVDTMVLRLQPELFRSIKDDHRITGRPMRELIMEPLERRYQ